VSPFYRDTRREYGELRTELLTLLQDGPVRLCELADGVGYSLPGVSRHVRKLVDAGEIVKIRRGMYALVEEQAA
jgi:predicted transcriptional regulator